MNPADELVGLLQQAKTLAKRYRELTGRLLGIAGGIAAEAVKLLDQDSSAMKIFEAIIAL